ncbi:MAG: methyltransferase domain-containing protein [Fimbriimonadaceae bacterium]|nr:methyltransferase domain-containing protein [Fimbriimonadaceae bacterium]
MGAPAPTSEMRQVTGLPPLRSLLDPRPSGLAEANPIVGAVNIPAGELEVRLHELPARGDEIRVATVGTPAHEAVAWLQRGGRRAFLEHEFSHGPAESGRLWSPNAFLEEVLPELGAPGLAFDLGCGSGREAVALAAAGWRVTALDRLEDALAKGRDLERRTLGVQGIDWVCVDLESPAFEMDLAADLITSFSYLHRPLLRWAAAQIRPGGSVVVETFTEEHRKRFGKPRTEAFVLAKGELPTLLPGLEVLRFSEGWRADGRHTARLWARKP